MPLANLETIAERVRVGLEGKNTARDLTLRRSRELIRVCANAIRAAHRNEFPEAAGLLDAAQTVTAELVAGLADYPDLYYAGYTQDAMKEYAEANITVALIRGQELPEPEQLGVEYASYLNGLGEAAGELRRYALDALRRGEVATAEAMLLAIDEIYTVLIAIDFPDALTGGLRRTTDMVRGVLERTRGDLTVAVRQQKLEEALKDFEGRFSV